MAVFWENLGLDFIRESNETIAGLLSHVAETGSPVVGYYGCLYLNRHYGSVQVIARVLRNDAEKTLEFTGLDTHVSGDCVWTVRLSGMQINRSDADILERRVAVNRLDGKGGLAVVNLVNADVLPSFLEGDIVKMQMTAFPTLVKYYCDEAAYEADQPRGRGGRLFLLAPGTIFPSGLLNNRSPDNKNLNINEYNDDFVLVRGPVKRLSPGDFELEGETAKPYLRCVIDTEFGELELAHTLEQVPSEMRENIKVGATVSCVCVLSGNVAIDEYANGLIFDEEHDLAALRGVLSGGDPKRLSVIFSQNAKLSAKGEADKCGADSIIGFIADLTAAAKSNNVSILARMGRVVSVKDAAASKFAPGKRCLSVSVGESDPAPTYFFVNVDESGKIAELYYDSCTGCQFELDKAPVENAPPADFKIPESIEEPIFLRAQFHGLLKQELTLEEFHKSLESCPKAAVYMSIMSEKPRDLHPNEEEYFSNLFGYLLAKSAETEYARTHRTGLLRLRPKVTVTPSDAWAGRYGSAFKGETHKSLAELMELGKQFRKDYSFYREQNGLEVLWDDPDLEKALRAVCLIGEIYSRENL